VIEDADILDKPISNLHPAPIFTGIGNAAIHRKKANLPIASRVQDEKSSLRNPLKVLWRKSKEVSKCG
jgi:hypothetical protein